jgi:hypothetical protein
VINLAGLVRTFGLCEASQINNHGFFIHEGLVTPCFAFSEICSFGWIAKTAFGRDSNPRPAGEDRAPADQIVGRKKATAG